jgi:hypothetical protein
MTLMSVASMWSWLGLGGRDGEVWLSGACGEGVEVEVHGQTSDFVGERVGEVRGGAEVEEG